MKPSPYLYLSFAIFLLIAIGCTKQPLAALAPVAIDPDFHITNVGDAIFPINAYNCDTYAVTDGIPLSYSKIDFFLAQDAENAAPLLLGTTPPGGAGSGECDLTAAESSLQSQPAPGKYRLWAVRYINNQPDKQTAAIAINL